MPSAHLPSFSRRKLITWPGLRRQQVAGPRTRAAVILAAGRGSRLDPGTGASEGFSKPLIRVGGMTLLERTVTACREAGAERILVVTGFRAHLVRGEVARWNRGDVEVVHNPDWQRKNGLSLYACKDHLDESFALMMSDHIFDPAILAELLRIEPPTDGAVLAVDRKIDRVFDLDDATKVGLEGDHIRRIHKQLDRYDAIDTGLFLCTPAVFAACEDAMVDGDCSLSDAMGVLGRADRFVAHDIGDGWWQDVDTPEMRAEAAALLARHDAAAPAAAGAPMAVSL